MKETCYLTCAYRFNAFHKMWNGELSEVENLATFGKCANPAGHGHTYRLEITFARGVTRERPFVIERRAIGRLVGEVLEPRLAFADLNRAFGKEVISSGERIAMAVWELIEREFECDARLVQVRVVETGKNSFLYRGEPEGELA